MVVQISSNLSQNILGERSPDGKVDYHRLLASMMSGRTWGGLFDSAGKSLRPSSSELEEIQRNVASSHFFIAILEILRSIPREMLLLLKTNDLLRAVDLDLNVATDPIAHLARTFSIQGWYCAKALFQSRAISISSIFEYVVVYSKLLLLSFKY